MGNINFQASYNKIKSRYYNNLSLLRGNNSYIFGQRITPFANMKYGYYNQIIAGVGCELVAIYNTLKFIKKLQNFANIILEAEKNNLAWLGGCFGTKSENIGKFFNAHNIKYTKYTDIDKYKQAIKSSRITIVSVWNDSFLDGIHTYCIYYENKKYKAINLYTNIKDGITVIDLRSIKKNKFIVGYCF